PPGAAGLAAGTVPSALGDRLVTVVVLETIGAGRNCGATEVRQPQYLSSLPRKRLSSSSCESCSAEAGGAVVVENPSRPPATSCVPVTPTFVFSLRMPSKCSMENLKSPLSFWARRTALGSHQ